MTYQPISKRDNIENKDIAKILDYLERHCLNFEYIRSLDSAQIKEYKFDSMRLWINETYYQINYSNDTATGPTQLLARTIGETYAVLKKLK